ncbi:hypothetical protein [Motiliproteus sp. SC1-56]|uniref:hypothetical protein n=1 Tax=Motiliproteus sp. SC1-56 TaxID=2799565 RepID=UPI001A8EAFA4|nr:hypothetical protein [Motiliproteus sp. SC1-56]
MNIQALARMTGLTATLVLSASALAAGDAAPAQTDPFHLRMEAFDKLDENQDGQLSASEGSKDRRLSRQWTRYDTDESGTVDRAEFSAFEEDAVGKDPD